jgi:TonB-linked SusC/RagA family outer membrane protein
MKKKQCIFHCRSVSCLNQMFRIMKLTTFLLFVLFLRVTGSVYSQNSRLLSIKAESESVGKILSTIEDQTEIRFLYNSNNIDVERKTDIACESKSIEEILSMLFKGTDVKFRSFSSNYVLYSENIESKPVSAQQQKSVSGRVTDNNGQPIPGVTVVLKGNAVGTSTDLEGKFSIPNISSGAILQFSFVGMKMKEVEVGTKTTINVMMEEESIGVEEVMVVGYGTQKRAKITGAVSSVKMDEVVGSRSTTNVSQLLQGNIPGLQITYASGEPGTTTKYNIRGITSIGSGSNSSPLILLDNVPVASLDLVNPNDIETVTVLKDAGSAAVYGARAAWGVVLVTSKNSAKKQKTTFEYSNNIVLNSPLEIPQKATPIQVVQSFKDMNFVPGTGQNVDKWLSLLSQYNQDPTPYPLGYTFQNGVIYPLKETDVWDDMMSNHSFQQTHNLTISGSSEKSSYRISGGFTNEDGILVTNKDSYNRINLNGFISTEIAPWATAQLTTQYNNSNKKTPYTGYSFGIFGSASVQPSYQILGDSLINDEFVPYATPRHLIEGSLPNNNRIDNMRLSGKVILKPLAGLSVIGEYTYDKTNTVFTQYDKAFNVITLSSFVPTPTVTQDQAKYYKYNDFTDYHALNVYATYEKKLRQDHLISFMAGLNREDSYFELLNAKMSNMINPNLPYLDGGTGTIQPDANGFDGFSEYAVAGYFYRFNYTFKGKYLFETTGRYDGSSKFPEGNRWGFFPSFSLGWRIADESFMKILKSALSDLKIRASYGNVGNQSIGNYLYYAGMTTRPTSNWADASGVRYLTLNPPSLISTDFTWEKVTTINLGVDFGLFNNKFSGVFDIYRRDTKGMLIPGAQLPSVLGASSPLQNSADLTSTGWELQVTWKDKIGKFNYNLGFNLFDNQGKITKYDINSTGLLSQHYVGEKIGEIWGYETNGFYTVDDFVTGSLNGTLTGGTLKPGVIRYQGENPNPGDVKFKDLNNDGVIYTGDNTLTNPGDRKIIGNSNRRYQYGFHGGANWKNFDCSFFIQGIGKRDLFVVNDLTYPYASNYGTLYSNVLDYWKNDHVDSFYGRIYNLGGGNSSYNKFTQTRYLQNGAYMRLKNLTLGYSVPPSILKKMHLQMLRVFISGEDLFTLKHMPKGVDPELSDLGYGGQYPIMSKTSVGLTLNF